MSKAHKKPFQFQKSMDWFKGKSAGKPPYLLGKSMISCKFSLKPIQSRKKDVSPTGSTGRCGWALKRDCNRQPPHQLRRIHVLSCWCHVISLRLRRHPSQHPNIVVCMKIIYKKNHKDIATYTQPKNPAWEIWRKHHRTTIQETRGSIFFNSFWGLQLGAPKMGYPKIPWFPFLKGNPSLFGQSPKIVLVYIYFRVVVVVVVA